MSTSPAFTRWLFIAETASTTLATHKATKAVEGYYSKCLLLFNLGQHLPGGDLRRHQLYMWKKRGVFRTMVSRQYGPKKTML